ncbi:hypothetical protein Pelo_3899 [Pelomyxa schiedti]|nr:hypothetical protein Pelo_3899 [Pelomyxa schiedti]
MVGLIGPLVVGGLVLAVGLGLWKFVLRTFPNVRRCSLIKHNSQKGKYRARLLSGSDANVVAELFFQCFNEGEPLCYKKLDPAGARAWVQCALSDDTFTQYSIAIEEVQSGKMVSVALNKDWAASIRDQQEGPFDQHLQIIFAYLDEIETKFMEQSCRQLGTPRVPAGFCLEMFVFLTCPEHEGLGITAACSVASVALSFVLGFPKMCCITTNAKTGMRAGRTLCKIGSSDPSQWEHPPGSGTKPFAGNTNEVTFWQIKTEDIKDSQRWNGFALSVLRWIIKEIGHFLLT